MASKGVKVAATVDNGGRLSTGEIPKKIVDLNTAEPDRTDDILDGEVKGFSESVDVSGGKKDDADSKAFGSADSGDVSPVDDIQKKIRRAERFGVSVKFTEEEKRNTRAERFGTVSAANDSVGTKKAEELKRKARADRFGVPASSPTSDNAEEDVKKKARLTRFGKDAKVGTKVDSAEEDKRKARALRFSNTASDLPGKQNTGKKAAVSGNPA